MRNYFLMIKEFQENARVFLLGNSIAFFGMAIYSLLFNLYLKELGKNEAQIGQILSYYALAASLSAFVCAFLLEKYFTKSILSLSASALALSYVAQASWHDDNLLKLGAFLTGCFTSIYTITIPSFFMRNSELKERMHLFSAHAASTILASMIGHGFAGVLPSLVSHFLYFKSSLETLRYSIVFAAFMVLISTSSFLKIKKRPIPYARKSFFAQLKATHWEIISRLMVPKFFVGLGAGMIIPFLNLYLKDVFNMPIHDIGQSFAFLQVFIFLGMVMTPYLVQKIGKLGGMLLTSALSIPFMLVMALSHQMPFVLMAFFLRGMLMNMSAPITSIFEMEKVEEQERTIATAMSFFAWNGAWAISTRFAGGIIQTHGFRYSFILAVIPYTISILGLFFLFYLPSRKKSLNCPTRVELKR